MPYKDKKKQKEYAKKYYKNYFKNPENKEKNKERTRKRYWISKICDNYEGFSVTTNLMIYSSKELKTIYDRLKHDTCSIPISEHPISKEV